MYQKTGQLNETVVTTAAASRAILRSSCQGGTVGTHSRTHIPALRARPSGPRAHPGGMGGCACKLVPLFRSCHKTRADNHLQRRTRRNKSGTVPPGVPAELRRKFRPEFRPSSAPVPPQFRLLFRLSRSFARLHFIANLAHIAWRHAATLGEVLRRQFGVFPQGSLYEVAAVLRRRL
jgi:hypothetical protein